MTTPYDTIPYSNYPFYYTHPDRLYSLGRLSGLDPAHPTACRLLELGCGRGGNIVPMAHELTESTFVGIDLSSRQIEDGVGLADAAGVTNLELRCADILDPDAVSGTFDYIICHGVYSWVPEPVREAILRTCKEHLDPQGVAFVSYNTYPGWGLRGMIRDLMLFHVGQFEDPQVKVRQARAVLDYVAGEARQETPYGAFLQEELGRLREADDAYLFHEHLAENNEPFYYHQFVELARGAGLRCFSEATTRDLTKFLFADPDTGERDSAEAVRVEQYGDFLHNRSFRGTLLCHAERELPSAPPRGSLDGMHVLSAPQERDPTLPPLVASALEVLARIHPQSLPVADVQAAACLQLKSSQGELPPGADGDAGRAELRDGLARLYAKRMRVELLPRRQAFVTTVSEKPVACPLARAQVEQGSEIPTNRRHGSAPLINFQRRLLLLLDGTRGVPELVEALTAMAQAGEIDVKQGEQQVEDPQALRQVFAESTPRQLQELAFRALLVG